jgi:hypothetical protein
MGRHYKEYLMDFQTRIQEIQARIDTLRKIIEQGEVENRPEPETVVKEPIEQPKPKSNVDDLKAKLMKKK